MEDRTGKVFDPICVEDRKASQAKQASPEKQAYLPQQHNYAKKDEPKKEEPKKKEKKVYSETKKCSGRQNSVHDILGGGKFADVLLWRNKKIPSGVLASSTAIWVLFEWLSYNFVTLTCFVLVIAMLIQFVRANASSLLNRSSAEIPRLVLPDELFVNVAVTLTAEINRFLGFLQDVASGRNLKQFLMVVVSLCVAAITGSWCNFLTFLYIGFVAALTLPLLYEKSEKQVDSFILNRLGKLQNQQYQKLDKGVLSKIPKGNLEAKKLK